MSVFPQSSMVGSTFSRPFLILSTGTGPGVTARSGSTWSGVPELLAAVGLAVETSSDFDEGGVERDPVVEPEQAGPL